MKRYFEFIGSDGKTGVEHSKFWEIWVDGTTLRIRYGKIGANGQTTLKSFESVKDAEAAEAKAIAEKIKKGYSEPKDSKINRSTKEVKSKPNKKLKDVPSAPKTPKSKPESSTLSVEISKAAGLTSGESLKDFSTATQVVKALLSALTLNENFSICYFQLQDVGDQDFVYENLSIGYFLGEDFVEETGTFSDVERFHEFMFSLLSNTCELNSVHVDTDEYKEGARSTCLPDEIDWEYPPTVFQFNYFSRLTGLQFMSEASWLSEASRQAETVNVKDNFHKDLLQFISWGVEQLEILFSCDHEIEGLISCTKCEASLWDFEKYKDVCPIPLIRVSEANDVKPESSFVKFCPECGTKREPITAKFCPECGKAF